ncbi:MAG: DUF3352 domain-containing protein, partial [Bacteroidetes bacterium]|nr:DUF3352 domain-containing protein [Bacteroidota bacterium]
MDTTPDRPVKKRRIQRMILLFLLTCSLSCGAYFLYNLYVRPDHFLRQIYLVPKDAMYIIETDDPVHNWHKFAKTKAWQYLKEQRKMEEINQMGDKMDSILHVNKTLLEIFGKRNLIISAHKTRKSDYDFLFIVDVQKASKMELLKKQWERIGKAGNFRVTVRNFKGNEIWELFDPDDHSTLYLSLVNNHLICSYTGLLVERSMMEKEDPSIGRDLSYIEVSQKVKEGGLCKVYLNYSYLDDYIATLTGVSDPDIQEIVRPLSYTGLQFKASDEMLSFRGYTSLQDNTFDNYLPALLQSGSHWLTAQKVLSCRTAYYIEMGFDDPYTFINNLEQVLQKDQEAYHAFQKNWNLIENMLKIDIRNHFLSWMEGEVVFAQHTPGSLGRQNEFVAVIKMKNRKEAVNNLNTIEESIRKHMPVKFKTIEYEGYEVHFLEMKGFFRLLFGKMFAKLDKPYYTIIDDYAVFSNSTATLLSMIEDHRVGQTLENDREFQQFIQEFNKKSTVFAYLNTSKSFPLFQDLLAPSTWIDLQDNQNFVLCFPHTGFQLTAEEGMFDTRWFGSFRVPEEEWGDEEDEDDMFGVNFGDRTDTLHHLERFYVEKFAGNVYTEFYEDGTVKSRSELSKGIKHGKFRAFYPSGKLQVTGKFKRNQKSGTWNFYHENGMIFMQEVWKNGQLK